MEMDRHVGLGRNHRWPMSGSQTILINPSLNHPCFLMAHEMRVHSHSESTTLLKWQQGKMIDIRPDFYFYYN